MGLKSTIVVPVYTPSVKINSIKREKAELILFGNDWNESFLYAKKLAIERQATIIHPFNDDYIINGQGTMALEILDKIQTTPDYFLASIGGGSMMASNAMVFKELSPKTKIIGLQTFGADAMYQSVKSKTLVKLPKITSIVESFATKQVSKKTFCPVLKYVDQILLLKDKECIDAAIFMLERANILLELSASICVAALIYNKFRFKKKDNIVMILCGGNLDLHKLATIISPHSQNNHFLK